VTGKVSHYRMAGPEMLAIFEKDDQFKSMSDATAFFTFQKGNGTLHGSKGIGRDIYELAGMLDRTRNETVDRLIMAGKLFIQGDVKRIHTFKMSVVGSTVIIPTGWDVLERKLDADVEPFMQLDAYFKGIVDDLIGSVSKPQIEGEAFRSPQAWALLAQREEESRDIKITRFMEQFTDLVGGMQRRMCDPDTIEEDAKEFQKEMLKVMTREELDELANSPVAGTIQDLTPMERQLIVTVAAEKRGNPLYNQRALEVEDMTARMGADFANRVILPDQDPTEEAEQHRLQQMELVLLSGGQPVPVSPRDNHLIHIQILLPAMEQVGQQLTQGHFPTDTLEVMGAHLNEHVNRARQQGAPPEALAPALALLKNFVQTIQKLKQLDAQAESLQAQSADLTESHMQDGSGGPPPGAPMMQ